MKFLLTFVGLLVFVAAYDFESEEKLLIKDDGNNLSNNKNTEPEPYDLILDASGKKLINNVVQNMPCGWPEYEIPPLAPYTKDLLVLRLQLEHFDSTNNLTRFRLDGANNVEIKKLNVEYWSKKEVNLHFNFPSLTLTAAVLQSKTVVDLQEELGIITTYESTGTLDFALQNVEVLCSLKYRMPWILGSIKITELNCDLSVGSVRSNIGGIYGNGTTNEQFNKRLEQDVPAILNGQQKQISETVINNVLPRINDYLEGKQIWYILGELINKPKKCIPEEAPWFAMQ